jgi:hypothetical protein
MSVVTADMFYDMFVYMSGREKSCSRYVRHANSRPKGEICPNLSRMWSSDEHMVVRMGHFRGANGAIRLFLVLMGSVDTASDVGWRLCMARVGEDGPPFFVGQVALARSGVWRPQSR